MKCDYCGTKMICVDDSGSFTQHSLSWDYYVCPVCRASCSKTVSYGDRTYEWKEDPDLEESYIKLLEEREYK